MSADKKRVLILGYGNPGRLDDGLGPMLAQSIEALEFEGVSVDCNYQLNIEDAARVAEYDLAIFADASVNGPEPFSYEAVVPDENASFTSHSMSPGQVVHLAQSLFSAQVRAYVLGIRGYAFNEFGEHLSVEAQENLSHAVAFIQSLAASQWQANGR